ncbi:MAG: NAD-dependent epimerase/dehydratase family protein [Bdellovibrionales bacterium]|nr:NAD-dependent epimerase/dehydratase family protein [Bdellovibrionales bacterium]
MARYLLLGGAGFVASHLCDRLLTQGHRVTVLDNMVTGTPKNLAQLESHPDFELIQWDITQKFQDLDSVDGVLHMASPASPTDFVELSREILAVGSFGTWNAVEFAKSCGAWLMFSSTSEVYGDPLVHPQTEDYLGNVNCIGIRGVYDESKRFSESVIMANVRAGDLKASIFRIFNTYGPRMRANDGRAVPNFIDQALQGKPISVHGDGSQTRSFCYIDDLVDGILAIIEKRPLGPLNLGNPHEVSILKIAEMIKEYCESSSEIQFLPLPDDDPKRRCPDLRRTIEALGWQPKIELEKGLRKTVDFFKEP